MKAAVLESFGAPLRIARLPVPKPEAGEVLVRVRAVGLCGSDLKLLSGATPGTVLPLVPGHEVAGELVSAVGAWPEGQRVACYPYEACGTCGWCRDGQEVLCPDARRIGRNRPGGLAEYAVMRRTSLVAFGAWTALADAAVAMDAVMTPWHALRHRASLQREESVLVIGAGGLGLHAVQVARAEGGRVAVVDPLASRREHALRLGAEKAADPADEAGLREWLGRGADVVLEASGTSGGLELGLRLVRRGGRVAFCGYRPGLEVTVDSARLAMDELTLLGCRAGRYDDAVAALAAVEKREIQPVIGRRLSLEQVNEGVAMLREGDVVGRVVIEFP